MTSMGSVEGFKKAAAESTGWAHPTGGWSRVVQTLRAWSALWTASARREAVATRRIVGEWWRTLGDASPRWFMILFGTWLAAAAVLAIAAGVYSAIRLS